MASEIPGEELAGSVGGDPPRQFVFLVVLLATMAAGTFLTTSLALFAAPLREDLGISRAQVGLLVTGSVGVGALVSPRIGAVADRIGGRRATGVVFISSAASFVLAAIAPAYAFIFLGTSMAGVAQAMSNPATNKLIAHHVGHGERGTVTGIKQSGVQVAAFLAGISIPGLAAAMGWRGTMLLIGGITALCTPFILKALPADVPEATPRIAKVDRPPLTPAIRRLLMYAFLMGFAGSVSILTPLFAEESLGYSETTAGYLAAAIGLTAVFGRIAWARWSEPGRRFAAALSLIGIVSIVASVLMLAAAGSAVALAWGGAVLIGASSASWNAPGMLAVMDDAGPASAGRASGVVVFGFLLGLAVGPPLFGATADATGSYDVMWLLSIGSAVLATVLMVAWHRTQNRT